MLTEWPRDTFLLTCELAAVAADMCVSQVNSHYAVGMTSYPRRYSIMQE